MRDPRMIVSKALVVAIALASAGCSDPFLPPSYLHELRILAVETSPLEAGPGESVQLRPLVYLPQGESLTLERWRFCPYQVSEGENTCIAPSCERELAVAADGAIQAEPVSLAVACAVELGVPVGPPAAGALAGVAIDSVFRGEYRSSSGLSREVAMRVPLYLAAAPSVRNRPPAIAGVRIGAEALPVAGGNVSRRVSAGEELEVETLIDAASMDRYTDQAGRDRTEEPLISFFATAGRFEPDRLAGLASRTIWRATDLEADQDRAELFLVARDLRGGQAVAGPFLISIAR